MSLSPDMNHVSLQQNILVMAVQIEKPRRPINVVLRSFARQSVQQLQADFRTQRIYPYEIYPGFAKINEYRKQHGSWYATGQGVKSFQYEVMSAAAGNETIRIEFLGHLRFADMGVVGGKTIDTVKRDRKARHNKRYVSIWNARDGDTHRPSIMREARHLEGRMQRYLEDYYGREVNTQTYRTFSGLGAIDLTL